MFASFPTGYAFLAVLVFQAAIGLILIRMRGARHGIGFGFAMILVWFISMSLVSVHCVVCADATWFVPVLWLTTVLLQPRLKRILQRRAGRGAE